MARVIEAREVLHAPGTVRVDRNGFSLFLDPERGNWIGTDPRGADLFRRADGRKSLGEIVADYATSNGLGPSEAALHASTFFGHLERRDFIAREPFNGTTYPGRAARLEATRLREFWIHTNNSCNLKCTHCLVSSGPDEDRGLPTDALKRIIDQAVELGVEQFFFTGGEPFVRPDIFDLIRHVTSKARLIILTNGLLFKGKRLEALRTLDREKLGLQISLDGSDASINDPIRGGGTLIACAGSAAVGRRTDIVSTRSNANRFPRQ